MYKYPVNKSLEHFIHKKKRRVMDRKQKNINEKCNANGISIITPTMRQNCMKNVFANYKRQNFKDKEMIIILNNNKMNLEEWLKEAKLYENVRVFRIDERVSLGDCLNFGVSKSRYDFIAKFDDDDYYGPEYLSDSIKAFDFTDADVVGKATSFVYFKASKILAVRFPKRENKYVEHMDGSTFLIKKTVFNKIKFADIPKGVDTQFSKDCIKNGFKIYSTNKYHHVYIRYKNPNKHTWKIGDKSLLKYCKIVGENIEDFRDFVNI